MNSSVHSNTFIHSLLHDLPKCRFAEIVGQFCRFHPGHAKRRAPFVPFFPTLYQSRCVIVVLSIIAITHQFFKHPFAFFLNQSINFTYKADVLKPNTMQPYLVFTVHHALKCFEVFMLVNNVNSVFLALQPSKLFVTI